MALTFNITDWKAWFPTSENTQPDVSVIPAMLRRRLSPLARIAMSVIMPLAETHGAMPLVYVSRHGDLYRTFQLLKDLAQGEPVSPTAFSLSVHNATAGLFSIQQGLTKNITAISCGDADLIPALLEALGQCDEQEPKVMCVFCDEPPPDIYHTQVNQPTFSHAVAIIISRGDGWTLRATTQSNIENKALENRPIENSENTPQSLELLSLLKGDACDVSVVHNHAKWHISRSLT